MKRSEAREIAFKLIYEASVQKDKELADLVADTETSQEFSANEYIRATLLGVVEKREEIDAIISENSHGWKLNRISVTSGAILRLAIYEMLYTSTPFPIVINEAVELAKKYDHEKAPKFINGILNTVAEQKGLKKPKAGKKTAESAEASIATEAAAESDEAHGTDSENE